MLSTDFKMTMKHNSSNNSIQSNKKMVGTIKKPTDFGVTGISGPGSGSGNPMAT